MSLTKTAQKILANGYENIDRTQVRKLNAMRELEAAGLITVETCRNDYGYEWYVVRNKKNIENAQKLVRENF